MITAFLNVNTVTPTYINLLVIVFSNCKTRTRYLLKNDSYFHAEKLPIANQTKLIGFCLMAFRILFVQIYIVSLEMPTDYRYSCEKPRFTHNLNSPEELGLSLKYSMNEDWK